MSYDVSIKVMNVSKIFKIYKKPQDRLKQTIFRKKYYQEFNALSNISFEVKKGETIGIIGRNGSGKSTLLQIIAGTLQPSMGRIEINGRVAALLELGSGFNPEFTGRENVFLNGAILGISRDEMERRLDDIMIFADIGDYIDQPVKTYSSGMYVRLAFAVAISVDPDILIVDEALAVGDGRFQLKCFERIKSLKEKGTTILLVSHDLQSIRQFCDACLLFDKGLLLEQGQPNEVVNKYTKILFSSQESELEISNVDSFQGANARDNDQRTLESKEFRYGSGEGYINNVDILDDNEQSIKVLNSCDEVIIRMGVTSKKEIPKPIYALTIKSIKGLEVYGTNTYFQNFPFAPLGPEQNICIEFRQKISLVPGNYFLSFGFVELVNDEIIPLDRRYDAIEIKVLPQGNDRSFGIANLDSSIKISYL
ncbi:ABC transporter ATP-binding protein [Paenibacillus tyrfis]|uniref:ABC transporter ATP-binding protein n=1 Tax=Paenibacillus tyrfis TaxID=1501230 RepID=UPI000B5922FD|nr:ABC transporter ATP-binding protein [Paenibacillus tyrfis]